MQQLCGHKNQVKFNMAFGFILGPVRREVLPWLTPKKSTGGDA